MGTAPRSSHQYPRRVWGFVDYGGGTDEKRAPESRDGGRCVLRPVRARHWTRARRERWRKHIRAYKLGAGDDCGCSYFRYIADGACTEFLGEPARRTDLQRI